MSRQPKRGASRDEPSGAEASPSAPAGRRERIRRPEPERVYPDRSPSGVFRKQGRDNPGHPGGDPGTSGSSPTGSSGGSSETSAKGPFRTIERGVREGYRVVEDYLREGQRVARQINRRQYGPRQMGDDLQSLTGRMFRDSTRLLALWLELMSSSVGTFWGGGSGPSARPSADERGSAPADPRHGESPRPSPGDEAAKEAPAGTTETAVAVEITSPHPARVTVHLSPGAAREALRPTPLSGDPDAPPITDVAFEPGGPNQPPVLRIAVRREQSPGIYHGVLVEPETHDHRGTVKVELREPAKSAPRTPSKRRSGAKAGASRKSSPKKSAPKKGAAKKSNAKKSTTSKKKPAAKKSSGRARSGKGSS